MRREHPWPPLGRPTEGAAAGGGVPLQGASMEFVDLGTQYRTYKAAVDERIHRVLDHGRFIMGPEVDEVETGAGGVRRGQALHHHGERHGLARDRPARPGHRSGRRGRDRSVHLHQLRRGHRAGRRETGVRRHRGGRLQHGRRPAGGRDHRAHQGDPAGEPVRPDARLRPHQRDRGASRDPGHRGRGPELRRDAARPAQLRRHHHRQHQLLPGQAPGLLRRRRRAVHRTTTPWPRRCARSGPTAA